MAISSIDIVQDNISGDCNLLAVHSPITFIIDVEYSGDLPELFVDIMDLTEEVLATFRCIFYKDLSSTVREFLFIASTGKESVLRGYMTEYDDFVQTAGTIERVINNIFDFILRFRDEGETIYEDIQIVAFHAARQFGQTPALTNIYDNDSDTYITGQNKPVYIYFYNPYEDVTAEITDGTNTYDLGSDTEIFEETFDSWSGVDPESHPTGWTVVTNNSYSSTWRMYESSPGIATFVLHDAPGKYFYLYNESHEITPGIDNYYLTIRYRCNAEINSFLIGYKRDGGGTTWTSVTLENTSSAWVEKTIHVSYNYPVPLGSRYLMFGLYLTDLNDIDCDIDTATLNLVASAPGYYRLKVDDLTEDITFTLLIDSSPEATKDVIVKPTCSDDILVKYIDENGQYRFYLFNRFYEISDNSELIGKTNKFITDIFDTQSNIKNIGYKNERRYTLTADDVSSEELEKLSYIYSSPQVFLYIGSGSDLAKDWVLVTIENTEGLVRAKKDNFSEVIIDVILPEHFTLSLL